MKWNEQIVLTIPFKTVIDIVSVENMSAFLPELITNQKLPGETGFKQTLAYKNKEIRYTLRPLSKEQTYTSKKDSYQAIIANKMMLSFSFSLEQIDENQTKLTYQGEVSLLNSSLPTQLLFNTFEQKITEKLVTTPLKIIAQYQE